MDGAIRSEDSASHSENLHAVDQTIQQQQHEAIFACNICLQTATHPVASTCGHLFCWECLFTWLRGQPRPCPVCRTILIQGVNIIPIFTHTGVRESEAETPSDTNATIPQRPPPPSLDRIPTPIPLPSPVGMNAVRTNITPTHGPHLFQLLHNHVPNTINDNLNENNEIPRDQRRRLMRNELRRMLEGHDRPRDSEDARNIVRTRNLLIRRLQEME